MNKFVGFPPTIGRKKVEEATGINDKLILKWTNHADLFRIKRIAGQFAELLETARKYGHHRL